MSKTALVTGASSGIGLEFARILASKKYNLILVARSTTKLAALKKELEDQYGIDVMSIPKDLSIPDSALEVYEELRKSEKAVDCLINNAGFGDFGFFHETDWEKEEMMVNLNVLTLMQLTKLLGTDMVKRRSGYVLNVASTAAFQAGPLMAVYYATKSFVLSFSEAIAEEWKEFGVYVCCLCPGATESNFALAAEATDSKLFKDKKLPTAYEVAEFGLKAMYNKEVVAIHGLMNKMLATSVRFSPRSLVRRIVRNKQEKATK